MAESGRSLTRSARNCARSLKRTFRKTALQTPTPSTVTRLNC
nr:MAG TPA: hypothetical protein [Caudoviricetes sp.]